MNELTKIIVYCLLFSGSIYSIILCSLVDHKERYSDCLVLSPILRVSLLVRSQCQSRITSVSSLTISVVSRFIIITLEHNCASHITNFPRSLNIMDPDDLSPA